MQFFPMDGTGRLNLRAAEATSQAVLELKYDRDSDVDVSRIIHGFPIRLTKSSKYVLGITGFHDY
jgi:hypothetical protein